MEEGIIPQPILPLIPEGATRINDLVSVCCDSEYWTYFVGVHPLGRHRADDRRSFQVMTSQLIDAGSCRQCEVIKAFGVSKSSVARAVRRYREGGADAFATSRRGRRRGTVLTDEKLVCAQQMLNDGVPRSEVAAELTVKADTLRKAVEHGRLHERKLCEGSDRSSRSVEDAEAAEGMGTACTRTGERVLAAIGLLDGASICFEQCRDVSFGGVLCALPALIQNGLLDGVDRLLNRLNGYYHAVHVLILLGFMALCRIKTAEQMRREAPGELGLLLGLDRIPEVRCLRSKVKQLAAGGAAERWAEHLSRQWMQQATPEAVGTLYVDGHVRVYHGKKSALPRRYVSRQRLCLRGTTDYWVNDAIGRPFFVVEKPVDPGLLQVLRDTIVPQLLLDVAGQPSETELERDPCLSRFVLVFDREGYSPAFFAEMWRKHRVACITYHKHPRGLWPEEWFLSEQFAMPDGEIVTMRLAEMGSLVGTGSDAMWMREVRKLTENGHQVSLISTAFSVPHTGLASRLFSRWCQENFLRYMMQHFALDLLGEYGTAPLPDTESVVNPEWRELERKRNSLQGKLIRREAKFGTMTLHPESPDHPARFQKWQRRKAELLEEIEHLQMELHEVKQKLRDTPRHLRWEQLPDERKFWRLAPSRRKLLDAVRMIAYRAETAIIPLLLDEQTDSAAARTILQTLFRTPADLIPEPQNRRLRIRLHRSARPAVDRRIHRLLKQLNAAEMAYPGTDLIMSCEMLPAKLASPKNGVTLFSAK